MSDEPAGAPKDQRDAADGEPRRRSGTIGWALTATIAGAVIMIGSVIPSLAQGQRLGFIVLGNAEVVPVVGPILFVMGLLVVLQEWSGLT